MKCCIVSILLLISTVEGSDRFFISAPNVFHVGTRETVMVQVGGSYVNKPVSLYLEKESDGKLLSAKKSIQCSSESEIQTVELMIDQEVWSQHKPTSPHIIPYVKLVAEFSDPSKKKSTRVLVSNHRGYIFIQTDQPMYNPSQKVRYRIFTLDHKFKPHEEPIYISVFNADGNRIRRDLKAPVGGMFKDYFQIPSVSKMGTWKIEAHYKDDEKKAAVREFKVQQFVLPSFEVNIKTEKRYILLKDEQLDFTVFAMYSYGEKVQGAYHCKFGVLNKNAAHGQQTPNIIRGLERTGSVQNGSATLSLRLEEINSKLKEQLNLTFADLHKSGSQLYVGAYVTNIQNGELQEGDVYLPIISQKYNIDLSRTRSYYVPGYPLDVVVVMKHPDGTSAAGVPVNITVRTSSHESWQDTTNQDGIVSYVFNIQTTDMITVEVSTDGLIKKKEIQKALSPDNSYLYLSITNKVYFVNDLFSITFNTVNGPVEGNIYYMVLSRGITIKTGKLPLGISVKHNLLITADMVPAFRLIGYYYTKSGDIIADSVWVDVKDECKINVRVEKREKSVTLHLDLDGQSAKVALLAVDKAFYALKADNKLTAKQVFSYMTSYDLGCTSGGGNETKHVLLDAGLAFVSQSNVVWRRDLECDSHKGRKKRSVDLQQEMNLKSRYEDPDLQACCTDAFTLIPMRRTCEERAKRVRLVKKNDTCVEAFLTCCKEAEMFIKKKMREEALSGFGRTASTADIEEFFLDLSDKQYIRRYFPPSFAFTEFDVNSKKQYYMALPDSITTWEIQIATLSAATGFCVVKPQEVTVFKTQFVSLRLPYSVKKFEQLSVSPVIYNYGDEKLEVAVNMEQTEGLCSPVSATKSSFVTVNVEPQSSQFVTFSAVPMVTGSIPITIRLYDVKNYDGIDAVKKNLNVQTEGHEQRLEETKVVKLDGKRSETIDIDGTLPDNTVPDSGSNIFISMEGDGFSNSQVRNLLSPEKVSKLIVLPSGCLEQTTNRLAPTVLALRYLDLSEQWFNLPPDSRDEALSNIKHGYMTVINYKNKGSKAYGSFYTVSSSIWATAYIVKIMSLVAERQAAAFGPQSQNIDLTLENDIIQSVSYLCSIQQSDGSFIDPNPVIHRNVQKDQGAWLTAFITLALNRSLQFLGPEGRTEVEITMSNATKYLQSQVPKLSHTYAMALTAYCLAACLPEGQDRLTAWRNLQSRAIKDEKNCSMWTENQQSVDAISIETTAYALLAAVALQEHEWADKIACWLSSQENYNGGYRSTQDTVMALEALSEYELKRSSQETNVIARLTVPGRSEVVSLTLQNKKEKVETDLKKFTGNKIQVQLTGRGNFKLKTVRAFHVLDPEDECNELSISVSVEGKVKYTEKIIENYDYYEDYEAQEKEQARKRRDVDNNQSPDNIVTYRVCVTVNSNLSGMAIADITLLSGFEAEMEDLERLKKPSEQYISHYELSFGRVLIYFNELFEQKECISFDAKQKLPVGLLQPAPAVFYDYYEPDRKCTVFYSAPKRSKMVSKLCSEDVCQCAERPCHKIQETFKSKTGRKITKNTRAEHACFFPTVDYAYIVEVQSFSIKSNFELYKTKIIDVLKVYGDRDMKVNSVRVFAKRLQCKEGLEIGKLYLIMGKDGSTKDSSGQMQYLLESNTWVERKPLDVECQKLANRRACEGFNTFIEEYKINGCMQ